jgi:peroxiredoxin
VARLTHSQIAVASVGIVALSLAVALALAMRNGVGGEPIGAVDAGFSTAASFELPRFDAGSVNLEEYRDQPVFLYFWASWCAPCRTEAPLIERLWPEFRDRGYAFVGVNIQDQETTARAFIEEHGLSFPVVRDTEGSVYLDYGVYGLPESFFLKPGLEVHQKYLGEFTEADLRARLEAIDDSRVEARQ